MLPEQANRDDNDVSIACSLERGNDVGERVRVTDADQHAARADLDLSERDIGRCGEREWLFFVLNRRLDPLAAGHRQSQTADQADCGNRGNIAAKHHGECAQTYNSADSYQSNRHLATSHPDVNRRRKRLRLTARRAQAKNGRDLQQKRCRDRDSIGPAQPADLRPACKGNEHGCRRGHVDGAGCGNRALRR